MVCRTSDLDAARRSGVTLEQGLTRSDKTQILRLVAVHEDDADDAASYEMPVASARRCVAEARQRRNKIKRMRAKRIENAVFSATAFFAIVATIFGCAHLVSAPSAAAKSTALVIVAPGDSVWAVAQRYTPAGARTAGTVAAIRSANPGLSEGRPLHVGQRILVPVAAPSGSSLQVAGSK